MFCCYSRLVVISVLGLFCAQDMSAEVLNKRSWLQATQYCTLLGSNNTGEVQIEKINISSDVPDDLYWVGAIVNGTIWFEVSGSAKGKEKTQVVDSPFLINCYFYCQGGNQPFVLMGGNCYCKFSFSGSSALYLSVKLAPSEITGSIRGDCVAFTRTVSAEYHQLLPCSELLPPICKNGVVGERKNWSEAVTSCNVRPAVSFSDLSTYNVTNGTTGWTGITRQNYGRIWATGPGKDTSLFGCIAVNVSSGNASLQEFPCNTNLTPLCEHGTILKETPEKGATETNGTTADTTTYLALGLASGFGLLVILIVVGFILLKRRNKLKARRSSKASFHNKNYEVGMEGVNIPPLYAEVVEYVSSTDKTPQGNPRDSGGSDSTYDHTRVQSLGRILTDDDYDHLQ